jgi:hypothetical protein
VSRTRACHGPGFGPGLVLVLVLVWSWFGPDLFPVWSHVPVWYCFLVPVWSWFDTGLVSVPGLVLVWSWFGPGLVPVWSRFGPDQGVSRTRACHGHGPGHALARDTAHGAILKQFERILKQFGALGHGGHGGGMGGHFKAI